MCRQWLEAVLALALLPGIALADPPEATEDPEPAPVEQVVPGSVLLPATGFHPEVDGEPFPHHCPDPSPPPPGGSFMLYGGGYLMTPHFQTDPAFVRTSGTLTQQTDFTRSMSFSPLAGLGFTTRNCWGLRSRWFNFDEAGSILATSAPGETLTAVSPLALGSIPQAGSLIAESDLNLTSVDIEGTYLLSYSQWGLLLGTGVRYVHMSQDYAARLIGFDGSQTLVTSGHNFNGVGPTFSADGRLPFRQGRFALYGNLRFSLLFGDARESYAALAPDGTSATNSQSTMDVLPIGDLEVGGEYSWHLRRCRFFVQTGFVGQAWWGGGNSSNVDPLAGTTASGSNFGLFGVAFRAGYDF